MRPPAILHCQLSLVHYPSSDFNGGLFVAVKIQARLDHMHEAVAKPSHDIADDASPLST